MQAYYLRKYEETGDVNYLNGVPEEYHPKQETKDLSSFLVE